MKAVLGFLLLLGGITLGWLVLSGKFPGPAPCVPGTPNCQNSGITENLGNQLPQGINNPNLNQPKSQNSGGPSTMTGSTGVYGT